MSNFNRKIRRRRAKELGLPTGFFCKKMQNKLLRIQKKTDAINKNIQAVSSDHIEVTEDAPNFVGYHIALDSAEAVKDGTES